MTKFAAARSAWERLPEAKQVEEWAKMLPDAPERVFNQMEKETVFIHKMAWRHFLAAIGVFLLSLASTFVLAVMDKDLPAAGAAGGGAIVVVVTLLTGRRDVLPSKRGQQP